MPVGTGELGSLISDPGDEYKKNPDQGNTTMIPFTDESVDFLNKCEETVIDMSFKLEKAGLDDMPSRLREITMRLGLEACVMDDGNEIDIDYVKWAWELIHGLYKEYINKVKKHLSGSDFEAMKLEALGSLRKAGKSGIKPSTMPKTAPWSKWDKKIRAEILSELLDSGLADQTKIKTGKRGPGSMVWVAIE